MRNRKQATTFRRWSGLWRCNLWPRESGPPTSYGLSDSVPESNTLSDQEKHALIPDLVDEGIRFAIRLISRE